MNDMQVFNNTEFGEISVIEIDGKPYFPATKCAEILGYSNPRKAVNDHCRGVTKRDSLTIGGSQEMNFIPEGDLYRLIVRSKLPSAERFEKWVFDEVLPSIRKTGAYVQTPQTYIQALQALIVKEQERLALEQSNESLRLELDKSKEWFSIKRVASINKANWKDIDWRVLKNTSRAMEYEVRKIFDGNYGSVNCYNIAVWQHEYPNFRFE
jgi:prophage antirepressor-like protein